MNKNFTKSELSNGVRILTERLDHVGSAAIGLWCTTGSTHESESEAGITHFIEHMLFKGTERRTAHQIAEEIEGRGGMLNAFTDKERTCYYCRVLKDDCEIGFDVLSDMLTHSRLDADDIRLEQGVVLEEIKRSEDEPGDHVHELHTQGLWDGHKLGLPILGTRESVSAFDREQLRSYIDRRYKANRIIVTASGNVNHDDFHGWAEKALGNLDSDTPDEPLTPPEPTPGQNYIQDDVEQVHFCIGTEGSSHYGQNFYPLIVLDGVLGGGMSSRLFQEIREKRGLAYAIGSYMLSYTAGGSFTIYGGTGLQTWQLVQDTIRAELDKIIKDGPTEAEVAKVKRQIAGNLVLGLESTNSRMMRMAKNEIVHGRQIPIEETVDKINAVTVEQIQALGQNIFAPERMRVTAILPSSA
ncbi:pitrilysin family protein [Kamptonema cortianum]|nr:pitrilysin family protein [Geitlerinema splendidum]MDK3160964.1 pitrilysin family protein [Kamptonema cortianum]